METYELFAYQESRKDPWKLIKQMKALNLPMACVVTLTINAQKQKDR